MSSWLSIVHVLLSLVRFLPLPFTEPSASSKPSSQSEPYEVRARLMNAGEENSSSASFISPCLGVPVTLDGKGSGSGVGIRAPLIDDWISG